MVHLNEQRVTQTLSHYAHGQRVRLQSDTAPFRVRLPGGSQRHSACLWCCCDPFTDAPVDADTLVLDDFVVHRGSQRDAASTTPVCEFTIEPRAALPSGKPFTFHFRYVSSQTGERLSGRDARYRVTVFYAA